MNFSVAFEFAAKVWGELKDKPATGVILVALVGASFVNWQAISGLKAAQLQNASAKDMAAFGRSLSEFKLTVQKSNYQAQIHSDDSEIFRLQRAMEEMYTSGRTPDPLYSQRIREVQEHKDQINFELTSVQRALDAINKP